MRNERRSGAVLTLVNYVPIDAAATTAASLKKRKKEEEILYCTLLHAQEREDERIAGRLVFRTE